MNKITLLLFFFIPLLAYTKNTDLVFNKEYYYCENKWVILPKLKEQDTTHMYGFIYLDRQAGFTFSYEGNLKIDKEGKYIGEPIEQSHHMIYRIPSDFALLALLPANKFVEMGLPEVPEWLHHYTEGENEVSGLVERGFHFNHIGASQLAVVPLEQAYKRDPHAEGLEFELSHAYNAIGRYTDAIKVLEAAMKNNPKNGRFYRELGYAYIKIDNLNEAEKIYRKGIDISKENDEKAEMAFNVAGAYWKLKDRKNFDKWAKIVRQYASADSFYLQNLDKIEAIFDN